MDMQRIQTQFIMMSLQMNWQQFNCVLYIFIKMFVSNTFLNVADRLSAQTTLTGRIGSLIGLILTAIFIILCFILFLGPVISYFEGDYFQSSFETQTYHTQTLTTGKDFRMMVSFYNKLTGNIIDHRNIKNLMDDSIKFLASSGDLFYAEPSACNQSMYNDLSGAPEFQNQNQCLISPYYLVFTSQLEQSSGSAFGFIFTPICENPFLCIQGSSQNEAINQQRVNFLREHYYVMYFTSQIKNRQGKTQLVWQKAYSTQWSIDEGIISNLYVSYETQQFFIDDSVMPWRNNQSDTLITWFGKDTAYFFTEAGVNSYGLNLGINLAAIQTINFRFYKKLDWLLGMLGGGIFLLYLIFWAFWNLFSAAKARKIACEAMILIRNKNDSNDIKPPELGLSWYFVSLVPDIFGVGKQQKKLVRQSENMLDIVNIIKKQKVTLRNIRKKFNIKQLQLNAKVLQQEQYEQNQNNLGQKLDETYQLPNTTVEKIKNSDEIQNLFQNNTGALLLNNSDASRKKVELNQEKYNIYSQYTTPFKEYMSSKCKKILNGIAKFIRLFDAFGARPMLTGQPYNSSFVGCIFTFIIIILAILTFALTLQNMGNSRTYMDKTFIPAQQLEFQMMLGTDFKVMVCFLTYNFQQKFIGQNRIADTKFYQYNRQGNIQILNSIQASALMNNPMKYFDISNSIYDFEYVQPYCLVPDNRPVTIGGNSETQSQSYIGFTIKPYCGSSPAQCEANYDETLSVFKQNFQFINTYILLSENKYFPERKQIVSDVYLYHMNQGNIDWSQGLELPGEINIKLKTKLLQIIQDQQTWIVGTQKKQPTKTVLSTSYIDPNIQIQTDTSSDFSYDIKFQPSGEADRVIITNYKIDFLFATIGGCFMFFYLIFGCCGRLLNSYLLRIKIAEKVYQQQDNRNCLQMTVDALRLPCSDSKKFLQKINSDVDSIYLAQRIDTLYKLSSGFHDSLEAKNLSLVYLKEVVKEQDGIIFIEKQNHEDSQDSEDQSIYQTFYEQSRLERRQIQRALTKDNAISNADIQPQEKNEQKIIEQAGLQEQIHYQSYDNPLYQTNRGKSLKKCCSGDKIINNLDIFSTNAYLSIDGKRSVKSICGGVCCMILLVFMILIVQHFVTLYSNNLYTVSFEKQLFTNDHEVDQISLKTGQNFMLAVSFFQKGDYRWKNVSSIIDSGITIQLVSVTQKKNAGSIQTQTESFKFNKCTKQNFLDFYNEEYEHDDDDDDEQGNLELNEYFKLKNVQNAYCVPYDQAISLYGRPDQQQRRYFKLVIKNSEQTEDSLAIGESLLNNYIPRIHISRGIDDFSNFNQQSGDKTRYQIITFYKSFQAQTGESMSSNMTLTQIDIQYDTAINPSAELPIQRSYDITLNQNPEISQIRLSVNNTIFWELKFHNQNFKKHYLIRTIKANELFGIIGGAILFVFFGLGAIPRNFNNYWMRMIIASRLYELRPDQKKAIRRKFRTKKGHKKVDQQKSQESTINAMNQVSQWNVFKKWLLSFYTFVTHSYKRTNKTLYRAALLESRVSNDMNIINVLKNIHICQDYINKTSAIKQFNENNNINVCRTYFKRIVPQGLTYDRVKKSSKNINEDLKYCAMKNNFSDWDLNAILKAKKKGQIHAIDIFDQKWLDEYFGQQRTNSSHKSRQSQAKDKKQVANQSEMMVEKEWMMNESSVRNSNHQLMNTQYVPDSKIDSEISKENLIKNDRHQQEIESDI